MYDERDHIHTLIYANRFAASPRRRRRARPSWPSTTRGAGSSLLMVDRHEDVSPKDATAWLRDELLPDAMAGTPWALTVGLTPIPLPKEAPVFQPPNPGEERRTAMLCFLECDPRECWEVFAGLGEKVAAGGIADVSYYAPVHPHHPRHRHLHRPALVAARARHAQRDHRRRTRLEPLPTIASTPPRSTPRTSDVPVRATPRRFAAANLGRIRS